MFTPGSKDGEPLSRNQGDSVGLFPDMFIAPNGSEKKREKVSATCGELQPASQEVLERYGMGLVFSKRRKFSRIRESGASSWDW